MIQLDYQGELNNQDELTSCLQAVGFNESAARSKARCFAQAVDALSLPSSKSASLRAFFVPGRIEVFGRHTDYAGGRTTVAAVDRGFCLVAASRDDRHIKVTDASCRESIEFSLASDLVPTIGHWSNYPMTVARRVARNFPGRLRGADIAFASDLPRASGMSSSSAMMVAMFLALAEVNDLPSHEAYRQNIEGPIDLAGYLATIENGQTFGTLVGDRGVGTQGGSEDHTAIICAQAGHAVQFSYCPVRFERAIPVPSGYTFAVGMSGVVAEKTGAAMQQYNRASQIAAAVTQLWCRETGRNDPHMAAIVTEGEEAIERLRAIIENSREDNPSAKDCSMASDKEEMGDKEKTDNEEEMKDSSGPQVQASEGSSTIDGGADMRQALRNRFEHFLLEQTVLVPQGGDALAAGDMKSLGSLMDRSQEALDKLLGNQVPQTIYLAASARSLKASAASAFGAGFGGSVWALVERDRAETFLADWEASYRKKFPKDAARAVFFTTDSGPAVLQVR